MNKKNISPYDMNILIHIGKHGNIPLGNKAIARAGAVGRLMKKGYVYRRNGYGLTKTGLEIFRLIQNDTSTT